MAGRVRVEVSPGWAVAAIASIVVLAVAAPGGIYLLGFLGFVIATHELGHFVVARRVGMRPTELFWGFGPEVVAVEIGGCRYGIKALSLGGYVKLEGMTPSSELPVGFDERHTYRAASHRRRLATILAGPAVNLVTALVAFWLAGVVAGGHLAASVPAAAGDVWAVMSATGQALWTWVSNIGSYIEAVLDRSGTAEAPVRFLSPVGQAEVSRQAVNLGAGAGLQWLAILATAVGVVNLLPLPPLDGSHAMVAAVEAVTQRLRRDRSMRFDVTRLVPVAYLTIGVLVALSASAVVLDVRDLVAG